MSDGIICRVSVPDRAGEPTAEYLAGVIRESLRNTARWTATTVLATSSETRFYGLSATRYLYAVESSGDGLNWEPEPDWSGSVPVNHIDPAAFTEELVARYIGNVRRAAGDPGAMPTFPFRVTVRGAARNLVSHPVCVLRWDPAGWKDRGR
jgi:hypothetical protein